MVINGRRCERRVQKLYLPPRGQYDGSRGFHAGHSAERNSPPPSLPRGITPRYARDGSGNHG
jgi:hypothetical protein